MKFQCGTISIEGLKMSVDEIETYFYCEHDRQQTQGESQFCCKITYK